MTAPDLLRQLADCMEQRERLEAEVVRLKTDLAAALAQVQTEQKVWFSVKEAAGFIGRDKGFLDKNRIGPAEKRIPFTKGEKLVRYRREDLERYLAACMRGR